MSERFLAITIQGRPPTPNVRRHWRQVAHDNAVWKEASEIEARRAIQTWEAQFDAKWEPLSRAVVSMAFGLPDRRARDLDNLIASTKPLLDGLVAAGVLVDDSIDVITKMEFGADVNGRTETAIAVYSADHA